MDEERQKLEDQIWFTRVSRTKAENRLIEKEHFAQFINIYYSLVAIICSILSYHYNDTKMGLFTIIIKINCWTFLIVKLRLCLWGNYLIFEMD